MDIKFYNLDYYPIFIFAIIVGALLVYALVKRVKELNFYGALSKRTGSNFALRERVLLYKSLIFFVGFLLLCIVILRPLWGDKKSEIFEKDRDIIFVLDISKSMLANDVKPSRVELAKNSIAQAIPELYGARVALVSFAGSSEIRCPLTDDYDFFGETLKNCVPESALVGGSFLTSALEKVKDKLLIEDRASRQNIILISDGGDFITKTMDNAAQELRKSGANLTIIGIGDPVYESRIPLKDGSYLTYKDEYVKTKLENEFLKELAFKAGGNYIEIGTKPLSIIDILNTLTAEDSLKVSEDKTLDEYEDRYQVFLLIAIISFLIWMYPIAYQKKKAILQALIFMFCLNIYGGQGVDFYLAKDYKNAEIALSQELEEDPTNHKIRYNLAHAIYAQGDYEKAYDIYEDLLSIAIDNDDFEFQDRLYYDIAVVACMHAQSLANTDIKQAHAKALKSMELFRHLLLNASTNDKIPDAFLYTKTEFKKHKKAIEELYAREALREKLKAEFIKELEEQIAIEESVLRLSNENDITQLSPSQEELVERTKTLMPKVDALAKEESQLKDAKDFAFLMQTVFKALEISLKEEELCLNAIKNENLESIKSYSISALINLNTALALLQNSSSSSPLAGTEGEGNSDSEDYEEEEGEEEEDYDEDYSENYQDSDSQKEDFNEGASMMSLPDPKQLEGEILKTEKDNNARREQSRGKYQNVEKDW